MDSIDTFINGGKVSAIYKNGQEVNLIYKNGTKGYQKQRKEYFLTSSGKQYINTGIKPENGTILVIKARGVSLNYYSSIFGTSGLDNKQRFSTMSSSDGTGMRFDYGSQWGMPYLTSAPFLATMPYEIVKANEFNYFSNQPVSTNNPAVFDSEKTTPIFLFACHEDGKATSMASMELYYCKISKNSGMVFDAIAVPAGKPVEGKVAPQNCLYDKISKTFFLNQGTGSFGIGERNI